MKDIVTLKPAGIWWLVGLAPCWLISLFVYSFSVYTTLYPEKTAAPGGLPLALGSQARLPFHIFS
jgi:hypothetical protein